MNNKITLGIVRNIATEFKMPVCIDDIEQDIKGCFLLTPLISTESHIINNRYQRNYDYMVQYFPQKEKKYHAECMDVSDRLMIALGQITVDGSIMRNSGKMSGEIVDGVLNFKASYKPQVFRNYVLSKDEETELMWYLTQNIKLKE